MNKKGKVLTLTLTVTPLVTLITLALPVLLSSPHAHSDPDQRGFDTYSDTMVKLVSLITAHKHFVSPGDTYSSRFVDAVKAAISTHHNSPH